MALVLQRKPSAWSDRLAVGFCIVLVVVLVPFSVWKENKVFWTNEGGYPFWLREAVATLYYPYWLFTAALIGMLGWSMLGRFLEDFSIRSVWLAHALAASLFACTTLYVIVS